MTDGGRFKIKSTFGDSAESFNFKILMGSVNFPTGNDTLWWGTTSVYHFTSSNLPQNIKVKYQWNDGDLIDYGTFNNNDYLMFKTEISKIFGENSTEINKIISNYENKN